MGTPIQVPGRRWCSRHNWFHRDCADCVEADFDSLVERINEGWQVIAGLQAKLQQAQEERDGLRTYTRNQEISLGNVFDKLREAERDAAEQRELAEKYRGALEQFSLWLEQECTRGTLDLGFGPDWSAKKVQLALDRILAAEAQGSPQSGQEEGS